MHFYKIRIKSLIKLRGKINIELLVKFQKEFGSRKDVIGEYYKSIYDPTSEIEFYLSYHPAHFNKVLGMPSLLLLSGDLIEILNKNNILQSQHCFQRSIRSRGQTFSDFYLSYFNDLNLDFINFKESVFKIRNFPIYFTEPFKSKWKEAHFIDDQISHVGAGMMQVVFETSKNITEFLQLSNSLGYGKEILFVKLYFNSKIEEKKFNLFFFGWGSFDFYCTEEFANKIRNEKLDKNIKFIEEKFEIKN